MSKKPTPKALAALAASQGTSALARTIGVKRQVLEYWLKSGVPASRILQVEEKTGIPRAKIRPDLYQ